MIFIVLRLSISLIYYTCILNQKGLVITYFPLTLSMIYFNKNVHEVINEYLNKLLYYNKCRYLLEMNHTYTIIEYYSIYLLSIIGTLLLSSLWKYYKFFLFFFSSPIVRKYRINVISETDLDEKCNVIIMRNKTVLGTEYWYKVCSIKPISIEHGLLFSNENPMLNTWLLGNAFVHV